jgi:hypothetical protein
VLVINVEAKISQAIIEEYAEIFENNSLQLKSPTEEAENPIAMTSR